MKIIILAAGRGNSLATLTVDKPKCMINIGEETILGRQIRILTESGIKEENITVVIGYKSEAVVTPKGVRRIINEDYSSTSNSYSLALALDGIEDDVLVLDGDLVFDKEIITELKSSNENILVALDKDTGYGMTGIEVDKNGRAQKIGKHLSTKITFGSMMKLKSDVAVSLHAILMREENKKDWYTVPIANLLERIYFSVLVSKRQFYEINTYADYLETKKKLSLENNSILVTGASGFLGKKIYHTLKRNYSVTGIKGHGSSPDYATIDLTDYEKLTAYIALTRPNIIVHTAGIAEPDTCETNKEEAQEVNIHAVQNLVRVCQNWNIKLIHISTDYVFDGDKGKPYEKQDERNPKNYYGYTKVCAEDAVSQYENSLIIRIPIIYGYNDEEDKETFPIGVLRKLERKEEIFADNQQIRYPVLIDEVAMGIAKLLHRKGIVHISCKTGVTKYEWARIIAEEFGFDQSLIMEQNGSLNKRPMHVQLQLGDEDVLTSDVRCGTKILKKQMNCAFRLIYKSLPNQHIYKKNVGKYRYELGKRLAESIPRKVAERLDYIVPVPTSGLFYAMGLAEQMRVPYLQALIKPDSGTRSFQIADLSLREKVIQDKIYVIPELLAGKTIALVDEAIFTGTTLRVVCDMVRACGVKSIYICIPTPVCKNSCKQYVQPERRLFVDALGEASMEEYFKVDGVFFQKYNYFFDSIKEINNICFECFEE